MKTAVFVVCLSLLTMPALAATSQQQKMKTCNAEAAKQSLKGDARKAFMKDCLGARADAKPDVEVKPDVKVKTDARVKTDAKDKVDARDKAETRPMTAQQQKMKQCNAHAKVKELKGDERKQFMSACLKSKRES